MWWVSGRPGLHGESLSKPKCYTCLFSVCACGGQRTHSQGSAFSFHPVGPEAVYMSSYLYFGLSIHMSVCWSVLCAICLPIFVPHCSFTCLSWPSSCPVDPLSPSVCLPSPCTSVCRISLLVPLHPIHSTSLHPFMCPSVCLEHPSCLRLLIIFHSNLPKHFSCPDRLRCPMPALQRGRSAYSYWLNCPSLKQFLPPPSSLCLDGVIYIVN